MDKLVSLIANEPIALLGFLGISIAWLVKFYSDKSKSRNETRRLEEEQKHNALNTVAKAGYLADRVRHKQQIIFRFEDQMMAAEGTAKEDIEQELKNQKFAMNLINECAKEVHEFSLEGSGFDCIVRANKLHSKLERSDAIADDSLRAILGKPPI